MSGSKICVALLCIGLVLGVAACGGSGSSSGGSETSAGSGTGTENATTAAETETGAATGEPIVVGLAVAKSGPISPYDTEAAEAAELRAEQINAEGGINGRPLKMVTKDTRSDKAEGSNVATELVSEGADALIVSCDFDYGSPAAIVGQASEVPAISLCASAPKFADKTTIGEYAFSMGVGSDVEGSSNAEFASKSKHWKSVYILQDESLEYTKTTGDYFRARWKELGGTIVGEDSFPGGENVDVRAQAAKIKSSGAAAEFIYIPTWNPGGATAIRQLRAAGITTPILAPAAVDSAALTEIAGPVSEVYFSPLACYAYCKGDNAKPLTEFVAQFTKKAGHAPSSAFDLAGYDLVSALATAMEEANEISGPAIREGLEHLPPIETPTGTQQFFSTTCHKPIKPTLAYAEVQHGQISYVESFAVAKLSKIGEGNPCVGE